MRRKLALPILIFTGLALPLFAYAALININTASEASLETLPGIGSTKASAIIAYRNAHGPFATTKDIENVSGIGDSTYANISSLITVSGTDDGSTGTADTGTQNTTTASTTPASSSAASTYTPPPSSLAISLTTPTTVFTHVPFQLNATVENADSAVDTHAQIVWSFGDGSSAEGTPVQKVFQYPGTYDLMVTATDGNAKTQSNAMIIVQNSQLSISPKAGKGIAVTNASSEDIDLSRARLSSGIGSFQLPVGMTILASSTVMIPFSVSDLPASNDITLTSPDGTILARYTPPVVSVATPVAITTIPKTPAQEVVAPTRPVQTVLPQNVTIDPPQAQAAVVTATLIPTTSPATDTAAKVPSSGVLHSPWALGVLGVIVLAGGALMVL